MYMKEFYDQRTGEYLGCPQHSILKNDSITSSALKKALSKYILSVSGWRAILAFSVKEEDSAPYVRDEDIEIAGLAAAAFYKSLKTKSARILLGRDARPTGRILSEAVLRVLLGYGCSVDFIATSAAPEIMAYSNSGFDGFFYISASHNPIGHNGYKFGKNGGVLNSDEVKEVERIFRALISDDNAISDVISFLKPSEKEEHVLSESFNAKTCALSYYKEFILKTAGSSLKKIPEIGIVAELNGSARSASIDLSFLREHGAKVYALNNVPGQIVHTIVPEGENLELCRKTLEEVHITDPSYILGYVPDNDGDRGNLVYYSEKNKKAEILQAQQVFALIAMIETAHQAISGEDNIAIAVNGCTSYLADAAVSAFNSSVFRSDIGEANVVGLAKDLREKGYSVKVAGEGSNGGIIEYPSKVRDPMNSLMSLLKIYYVPGLYDEIRKAFRIENESPSLEAVINSLPHYTTTSAFSNDGVMHIDVGNFDDFKRRFEEIFVKESAEMMMKHGFSSYRIFQMEGRSGEEGIGESHRRIPSSGGYRIEFYRDCERMAFLWFSKSRTEALIRVMADIKGDDRALHDDLLSWHRELIKKAHNL